jgi:hypothetical protein
MHHLPHLRLERRFFALAAWLAAWPAAAAGYQAIAVENGGQLAVLVTHEGAPQVITEPAARDQEFCGTQIESRVVEIGAAGGLKHAIVAIDVIERGKAPDTTAVAKLDNRGCHFVPRVQTLTAGQTLEISNSDPILHSSHAKDGKRTVFNLALATKGQKIPKKIRDVGRLNVRCDAGHTWMNAWIESFPHPYHAVSDADGKALFADIPPGKYTVTVWHEALGTETLPVTIESGKTARLQFKQVAVKSPPATPTGTAPAEKR